MRIKKKDFEDSVEAIDAKEYFECKFLNCTLIYSGGPPPTFVGCEFHGSSFKFDAQAANTTNFLRAIANHDSGLSDIFWSTFPNISRASDSGQRSSERPVNEPVTNNE